MTAEILVMNRSAVAMAAQSGMTSGYGAKPALSHDSAKIFPLFKGSRVAMMLYGRADILGQPWESLITHYQEQCEPPECKTVREYAKHFLTFLDDNIWMFNENDQRAHLESMLAAIYGRVIDEAADIYAAQDEEELSELDALNKAIEVWHERYLEMPTGEAVEDLPVFRGVKADSFWDKYRMEINAVLENVFGRVSLGDRAMRRLWDIAFFAATKNRFYEGCTGMVFAGYGKDELMPAMCSFFVSNVVNYKIKRALDWERVITSKPPRSAIVPFADGEFTNTVMRGINTGLEYNLLRQVEQLVGEVGVKLLNSAKSLPNPTKKKLKEELFRTLVPDTMLAFQSWLEDYIPEHQLSPILETVESAGREELVDAARSIIELNGLYASDRGDSRAEEVAVITKKEGFVWYKELQAERQHGGEEA